MAEFWETNLILRVVCGSRAHGLATAESDEDSRGVCIPPAEVLLGLEIFEQHESPGGDHVIFSLVKFVRLALQGNPNIIETLFVEPQDVISINAFGRRLVDARRIFLSRRVGERFSRYAVDQLQRMERHHRWLVQPPERAPQQAEFGDGVEGWRAYKAALAHWHHYQRWRQGRNRQRAELETRYGYDTKHASHLCRLLKMGEEILTDGEVLVRRPDAGWLTSIRHGAMSYEEVIDWATERESRIPHLMAGSPLPEEPDTAAAQRLVVELQTAFLLDHLPRAC